MGLNYSLWRTAMFEVSIYIQGHIALVVQLFTRAMNMILCGQCS